MPQGVFIMMSKPQAHSRPTPGKPGGTQSEPRSLAAALLAGAVLAGMTGALLGTASPVENHATSSGPNSAGVRTVAYVTSLDSTTPPALGSHVTITKAASSGGQGGPSAQGDQTGCISIGGQ